VLQCAAVCCSVLQCAAVYCSVLQCAAVCCSVLQCVAVCCSVLQCAAVCCNKVLRRSRCKSVSKGASRSPQPHAALKPKKELEGVPLNTVEF